MALIRVNFMAKSLHRTVSALVVLPTDKISFGPQKVSRPKKYKTLYLFHGIFGSEVDWISGTRIQRWAEEKDLAVVMPAGENSFYTDHSWNSEYYSEFIAKDLVEFTRASFPLSDKKEDTFIGGLSMGGYGALYNGLKYHDTFGAIVALSAGLIVNEDMPKSVQNPVFFPDEDGYKHMVFGADLNSTLTSEINPKVLIAKLVSQKVALPKLYFAIGEDDHLLAANQDYAKLLDELGIEYTFVVDHGAHEWDFWDRHIKLALDWLPLDNATSGANSGNITG